MKCLEYLYNGKVNPFHHFMSDELAFVQREYRSLSTRRDIRKNHSHFFLLHFTFCPIPLGNYSTS